MGVFQIDPDRLSQFGARNAEFCVVTTVGRQGDFKLLPTQLYRGTRVVPLAENVTLDALFTTGAIPEDADVLVVCPGRFLSSPEPGSIGRRRISVLPCGSTPTTDEQIIYFLDVLHRSDMRRQEEYCASLAASLEETATVVFRDVRHGTSATFMVDGDYEWNQQAGPIEPGEQQVAPAGEFSALPTDINTFDRGRRLGLNGSLTVLGQPILHRSNSVDLLATQQRLFAALDTTREAPLRIDVEDGLITDWRALSHAAEPAAEVLFEFFDRSQDYRIVWELGIGCNEAIEPVAGNCGMNEMYGGAAGVLHLGLGLTPNTDFAITLCCRQTVGTDERGKPLIGARARKLTRTRRPDCGCVG